MNGPGKSFVNSRSSQTVHELREVLCDWIASYGSTESALKRKETGVEAQGKRVGITRFNCGKQGHLSMDCWVKQKQAREADARATDKDVKPMICYSCQEVGHKIKPTTAQSKRIRNRDVKAVRG